MAQYALYNSKNCELETYCLRKTSSVTVDQAKMASIAAAFSASEWGYGHCDHFIPNEKYKTFEILKKV